MLLLSCPGRWERKKMINLPEYTDGCFQLCDIVEDTSQDFPKEIVAKRNIGVIWFREISVYDRLRYEFEQSQKEITMKIRIPKYKGIDSRCVCVINGKQHLVYNATHVRDKNGFPETELTLIRPDRRLVFK